MLWSHRDGILRRELARWWLLMRAIARCDVVHFNFGSSILSVGALKKAVAPSLVARLARLCYALYLRAVRLKDLAVLRTLRKTVVMTFQGDDARQGDYCRRNYRVTFAREVAADYYTARSDRRKRRDIAYIGRHADIIYAVNPDLLNMLPPKARFLAYASVDPQRWAPVYPSSDTGRCAVVVHAPSHRQVKGTRYVLEAIEQLGRDGVPVEMRLVERVSHSEARRVYESADLVVDQLLAGWYGALAVEAMALGKPVVCYVRDEDLKYIPAEMRQEMPIIRAEPATIYGVLRDWLSSRRDELADVGRRSRLFVEKWHDPLRIAASVAGDYERCRRLRRARGNP